MSPYRVLFVCTGNTCRSPMAAGLLRHMLAQAGAPAGPPGIAVESAGISAVPGQPASDEAVAVMRELGIDLSAHRARRLTAALLAEQDLVLALAPEHRAACLHIDQAAEAYVETLLGYAGEDPQSGVADPLGGDPASYRAARDRIAAALSKSLPRLLAETRAHAGANAGATVHLGCDHRGFALKLELAGWLAAEGFTVHDWGCQGPESCDYPDYAFAVARAVQASPGQLGVLICSNGVGMAMAANKVPGVRAALCTTPAMAEQSRRHNDANVLSLGSDTVPAAENMRILAAWLKARFEGGRHARRVAKMTAGECGNAPAPVAAPRRGGSDGE